MVSIIILTYKRLDNLLENLKNIHAQSYAEKEVIVVDNEGSEETRKILSNKYPESKYVGMPVNSPCEARNKGIREASGEIVVTLDDDVMFSQTDALYRIVEVFKNKPDVDCMNFKIVFPDTHEIIPFNWFHPRDFSVYGDIGFETDYISEGAVAFRRIIFDKAGYYPEEFFLSHEGSALAYRMIDCGYRIVYYPEIEVTHKVSKRQRTSWRNSYYDTRNQIWLGIRVLPWSILIPHIVYRLFTTFCFSAARRHITWYLRAISDAVKEIPREWRYRKPISKRTVRRLKRIRKHRLGPVGKIKEFLNKTNRLAKYY